MQLPTWLRHTTVVEAGLIAVIACSILIFDFGDKIGGAVATLGDKDFLIRWTSTLSGAARHAIPVTLIDVDEETMTRLGPGGATPRGLIAELTAAAAAKRASGIYVDIDTTRPGPDDAALAALLAGYAPGAPPLALARRMAMTATDGKEQWQSSPSVFESAAAGHANIAWTMSATVADADLVIRRWRLTATECAGTAGTTYASPQLFATSVATPGLPAGALGQFLAYKTRSECGKDGGGKQPAFPRNADDSATISYLFDGQSGAAMTTERGSGATPIFRRISARSLLGADNHVLPAANISDEILRGRFVIIGASHSDSFDRHLTPLGYLPGALVVANAVATAPAVLDAYAPSKVLQMTLVLLFSALLAPAVLRLRGLVAGVIVSSAALILLTVLARLLAPSTALAIVGETIAVLAVIAVAENLLQIAGNLRDGKRWRALVKPKGEED